MAAQGLYACIPIIALSPAHFQVSSMFLCRMLLKYVTEVDPAVVDSFERTAPSQVVDAIKATVGSLLGSLPPAFFEVNIVTLGDNMRSLMYSFLMTGYLYRHVVDKLELQRGLDRALPGSVLQDNLEQDVKAGTRMGRNAQNLDGFAPVRTCAASQPRFAVSQLIHRCVFSYFSCAGAVSRCPLVQRLHISSAHVRCACYTSCCIGLSP